MLGLLRFALAVFVVITHLTGLQFFSHWGAFAVFGFYIVSGYLVTAILNQTYSFNLLSFATNRFLRLFPIYYVVAVTSLVIILVIPDSLRFHAAWNFKGEMLDILGNLFIFPFVSYFDSSSFFIVPPIWSVAVELVNYLLLWLFIARSRSFTLFALIISLAYHIGSITYGLDWRSRYFPFYAALLPFSIGACIFFTRNIFSAITIQKIKIALYSSLFVWTVNLYFCGLGGGIEGAGFNLYFYINLVALSILVYCITHNSFATAMSKTGKAVGDLAYPIFLTHWIIAFVCGTVFLDGNKRGLPLLVVSIIPITFISFILAWMANKWIEPIRYNVRISANTRQ